MTTSWSRRPDLLSGVGLYQSEPRFSKTCCRSHLRGSLTPIPRSTSDNAGSGVAKMRGIA